MKQSDLDIKLEKTYYKQGYCSLVLFTKKSKSSKHVVEPNPTLYKKYNIIFILSAIQEFNVGFGVLVAVR